MDRKGMGVVGLLFFGIALSGTPAWADKVVRQAEVSSASGTVEWQKSGDANWQAASVGQKLSKGDKVRTGDNSAATLTLDEGSKIELSAGSEFSVQSLNRDSATEEMETILALMKGKLKADVTPLKGTSKFEIETPAVVAAVRGTTLGLTINADGSISASDDSGSIDLIHEGENSFTATLEGGEEALISYNPTSGVIKVTSIKGSFDVKGPDGATKTLNPGDTVIFGAGPATFVPGAQPPTDAQVTETQTEPSSTS